jgi:hypothetical protein
MLNHHIIWRIDKEGTKPHEDNDMTRGFTANHPRNAAILSEVLTQGTPIPQMSQAAYWQNEPLNDEEKNMLKAYIA